MKKIGIIIALLCGVLSAKEVVPSKDASIMFVNFKTCVEKSKLGQEEHTAFESAKNQMTQTLEKTDKELTEIAKQLEDKDYMDGLSPSAEQELKQKFALLNQDFARYQNQYYQVLNQMNYKLMQSIHDEVSQAAERVRKSKNLSLILSEDSTFACTPSLDCTAEVIQEMDLRFEASHAPTAAN